MAGRGCDGRRSVHGFTKAQIKKHITAKTTFEEFFKKAKLNPNASRIKGVICGYRVEEIEDPLTQKCRYLDELARGQKMEKHPAVVARSWLWASTRYAYGPWPSARPRATLPRARARSSAG